MLFFFLLVSSGPRTAIAVAQKITPCKVGHDAAGFGYWMWPRGVTVKLYVVKNNFTADEIASLLAPVNNWNAVAGVTGSNVKFEYAGLTVDEMHCESCLTITLGAVFDHTRRHVTELKVYSAQSNQLMTWATIVVDKSLSNPKSLTNCIAHELGHNFGLLDCYECRKNSTVMNKLPALNESNNMAAPSECDVAQIQAAYLQLRVAIKPAPQLQLVVDEGEEPIDDDTPIVIRKPLL